MGKIISVSNQKGGVGKTTTALSLSAALGVLEKKVLLIDMDPQSNATSGLGVDSNEASLSSYDLIIGNAKASNIVIQTSSPNLDLIPAKIDLVGLEIEIVNESSREYLLKNALEKIKEKYEDIRVDKKTFSKVITARALKPLDKLISLFYKDIKLGAICIFPKGESWQSELKNAQLKWDINYSLETSITNKSSKIFIIKDAKRHNE